MIYIHYSITITFFTICNNVSIILALFKPLAITLEVIYFIQDVKLKTDEYVGPCVLLSRDYKRWERFKIIFH